MRSKPYEIIKKNHITLSMPISVRSHNTTMFACVFFLLCQKKRTQNVENFCQITQTIGRKAEKTHMATKKSKKNRTFMWYSDELAFFPMKVVKYMILLVESMFQVIWRSVFYILFDCSLWMLCRKEKEREKTNNKKNFRIKFSLSIVFVPFYGCNEIHFDVQTKRFTREIDNCALRRSSNLTKPQSAAYKGAAQNHRAAFGLIWPKQIRSLWWWCWSDLLHYQ